MQVCNANRLQRPQISQNCGTHNFHARDKQILTEMFALVNTYRLIQKKILHAHSNAHNAEICLPPT